MFSDTELGVFLQKIQQDKQHELRKRHRAYALGSLYLADLAIEDNEEKRNFLVQCFQKVYGSRGI
jgi:hypothetical protein